MYRYRVTHTGIAGTPYLSTFYFRLSGTNSAAAAAAVETFFTSTATRRYDELVSQGDNVMDILSPITGTLVGYAAVDTWQVSASGGGAMGPYANQGLLRLSTNAVVGGRRVEGKMFLPAVRQGDISNDGLPVTAYRTDYDDASSVLVANPDVDWVVWSRKNGTQESVESATTWQNFAVLRSRRD